MSLQRDTVAIPFTSGIQPATRARLLQPQKLLTAQNCFFFQDQGPQKRFGHESHTIRTSANYVGLGGIVPPGARNPRENFSPQDPGLSASWLYGWGIYGASHIDTGAPFNVSPQPNAGQLFGATTRDSEILTWDGHRMFSFAPSQDSLLGELQSGTAATTTRGPSCMPALRSQTLAKISDSQKSPDAADNGTLRVVAWLNSDGVTGGYSAYDSNNRACLVSNATLTFQGPVYLRCISVGNWFHILVADPTANLLEMRSFHHEQPTTIVSRSLGPVNKQFDIKKIDETKFAVMKSKGGVVSAFVFNSDGTTFSSFTPFLNGQPATDNLALAIEVDKNQNIGLAWQTTGAPTAVSFCTYSTTGTATAAVVTVTTVAANRRMTLSPRYLTNVWDIFVEDVVAGVSQVRAYAVSAPNGTTALISTRHRVVLASHAFRVGNRNFVWLSNWVTGAAAILQRTWFLCDAALLPVGKMDYGTANADITTTTLTLPGVNWRGLTPFKDRIVFHGALGYNTRVPITPNTVTIGQTGIQASPTSVFTESSIHFYELDFLPKMRAAQAGRCTYFAGAQLWACDGAENVEATFHMAPEGVTGTAAGSGGSLSAGTYRYRVDLCHKNLQNEEVRSWSIITSGITAVSSDKITVTIPVVPMTRREDAYFLIYRTAANGTVYYLANSRDPLSANFVRNNQASATFTYQDSLADATLITGEYHPANSLGSYIDPLPAPACELVQAGRDRLWLAGGELAPGEIAPSRLFYPGQTPNFSPALNIQVDRNAEPITAVGFIGDLTIFFRRTATYILDSDGPDNSFLGAWSQPRKAVGEVGAQDQDSVVASVVGLWFLSPSGIRRLNNSGGMDIAAGSDVDTIARSANFCSAMVIPQLAQIRWYSRDPNQPTVIYNYQNDAWGTWTGLTGANAVYWPNSTLAAIAKTDGSLWVETQNLYLDGASSYEMVVRTSWLHGAQLGDFQRIRRVALFGSVTMPTGNEVMNFATRFYYDERPFFDEELTRVIPAVSGTLNTSSLWNLSVWGGSTGAGAVWGSQGPWGDDQNASGSAATDALFFRDGVFRIRERPHRQKCSVISIEFSDRGCITGRFEPVVICLELARKPGLDRIPT